MTLAIVESSSGAASASATKRGDHLGRRGEEEHPADDRVRPRGGGTCSRVATPKFPPPPRSAQNRSGWCSASTRSSSPSAVTTSAASRSSMVSPCLRTRKPMPPRERDAADPDRAGVAEARSRGRARRPRRCTRRRSGPVSAQAVRRSASISSARSAERSSTMPPSETPWPAGLWPPLRTASSRAGLAGEGDDAGDVVGVGDADDHAPGGGRRRRRRRSAPGRSRRPPG